MKYLGVANSWVIALLAAVMVGLVGFTAPATAQGIFDDTIFDSDLIKAIRDRDNDTVRAAVISGANVNDRSGNGSPAIVVAAESRNLEAIQILAEAGARLDNRNRRDNKTALTVAAELGQMGIVRELLERGADPDRTGTSGETALIKAARSGHANVIEALIEGGADLEVTDLSGQTALEIAEQNRHRRAADVLREAGAY